MVSTSRGRASQELCRTLTSQTGEQGRARWCFGLGRTWIPVPEPKIVISDGTDPPAAAPGWLALALHGSTRVPWLLGREWRVLLPLTAAREPVASRLPGRDPAHAHDARRRARVLFAAWGLGEQASLGELVVGELVANAVCHGETPIWMELSVDASHLRVEVHDGGAGRPVRRKPGEGECGRGLELIDGLIELQGGERGVISDSTGAGKTVYVVLSL